MLANCRYMFFLGILKSASPEIEKENLISHKFIESGHPQAHTRGTPSPLLPSLLRVNEYNGGSIFSPHLASSALGISTKCITSAA